MVAYYFADIVEQSVIWIFSHHNKALTKHSISFTDEIEGWKRWNTLPVFFFQLFGMEFDSAGVYDIVKPSEPTETLR